jgi:hypothetical protein
MDLTERSRALSSSIVSRAKVPSGIGNDDRQRPALSAKLAPDASVVDCGKGPWLDGFADNIADRRREETE